MYNHLNSGRALPNKRLFVHPCLLLRYLKQCYEMLHAEEGLKERRKETFEEK